MATLFSNAQEGDGECNDAPEKAILFIKVFYQQTSAQVYLYAELIDPSETENDVPQACTLSSIIFKEIAC